MLASSLWVVRSRYAEYAVERDTPMKTIRVLLDKELLLATDNAARREKQSRSALVRDALREHIRRLNVRDKERRDRLGYSARGEAREEANDWEAEAVWPEE